MKWLAFAHVLNENQLNHHNFSRSKSEFGTVEGPNMMDIEIIVISPGQL